MDSTSSISTQRAAIAGKSALAARARGEKNCGARALGPDCGKMAFASARRPEQQQHVLVRCRPDRQPLERMLIGVGNEKVVLIKSRCWRNRQNELAVPIQLPLLQR